MAAPCAAPRLTGQASRRSREATIFDNVLIGIDGRQGGRDALALARRLAAPRARLTLAHVYGAGLMPGRGSALLLAGERTDSERMLERVRAEAGIEAAIASCPDRSVGRGLQSRARTLGSDLLVVGASCRHGVGRVLLGDDTQTAVNGTTCAVAVAPAGYADHAEPLHRIGVGYDGSPEAQEALAVAQRLAEREPAVVTALGVVSLDSVPRGQPIPADWPEVAAGLVDAEQRRLRGLPDVQGEATYGDPGEELEGFCRRLDLLVVGSRRQGPVGRLFNGSTSNYLARRASCPLLVLPRGTAVPAATGPVASGAAA